jgi:imidazolonepropionase-like amidohydrolase
MEEGAWKMSLVIKNGTLIDGTGRKVQDATVVVEGSIITAVGGTHDSVIPAAGSEVIDVSGMTVMPGLIDLHDLLHGDGSESLDGTPHDRFGEQVSFTEDSDAYLTLLMVHNAQRTLEAGFTTIRDTAAPRDLTIDIARGERDGLFAGPRILYSATLHSTYPAGKKRPHGTVGGDITGPIDAVRAVRQKLGSGADWINLMVTGGGAGQWGPDTVLLTAQEMKAATEEAHRLGKRVSASACGARGIREAVLAGVDCVNHGTHLGEDNDLIKMMVDRAVGWVPTLGVSIAKREEAERVAARGEKVRLPEYWLAREVELIDLWRRGFEKAMEAGVLTAIGSDSGAPYMPHGRNAWELEIFVRYGATEMEAIRSATSLAAKVLGEANSLGSVEPGKQADLTVVREDPLKDIRALQRSDNVVLVIKAGKIAVDKRREPLVG